MPMRPTISMKPLLILGLLLTILPSRGYAEIFQFTAQDGTVSFSNVPVDTRYRPFSISPDVPFSKTRPLSQSERNRFFRLIDAAAQEHRIDPALIRAVVKAESDYNPTAISSAGALGLMQLMPGTARDLDVKNPFDPEENIRGGVQYLRYLLDRFEGSVPLAVAAYHAGEQNVDRHGGIPPIPATKDYVKRVMMLHKRYLGTAPKADKAIYTVRSGNAVLFTNTPPSAR
jgi:soluble lytic murein transglycosylase